MKATIGIVRSSNGEIILLVCLVMSRCCSSSQSMLSKCSFGSSLCCSDKLCARPNGLTGMVLCDNCHDDFHENSCGIVEYSTDNEANTATARRICYSCYQICCFGWDACKNQGNRSGLIPCGLCGNNFHMYGCGRTGIGVHTDDVSKQTTYIKVYRCNACIETHRRWF